ncbi:MAG: tetratricopeptide repeat protein [Magnetococcales bacterium]|nr:tetratricopeptide repeat protein [Magnetococcales bacterium]
MAHDPEEELSGARCAHEEGRLEDAERVYRRILAADPAHGEGRYLLGVLMLQKGRCEEAAGWLAGALACKPDNGYGHYYLGVALAGAGRGEEGVVHLRRAVGLLPDGFEAWRDLGHAYRDLGRLEEAVAGYRQALAIRAEEADLLLQLGNALMGLERAQEAAGIYRRTLGIRPAWVEAWHNLGVACMRLGEWQEARVAFQEALALCPDCGDACNHLGFVHMALGDCASAAACYRRALDGRPGDADLTCNLGVACMELGRLEEAVGHFRSAARIAPEHGEACGYLLHLLLHLCDWEEIPGWLGRLMALPGEKRRDLAPFVLLSLPVGAREQRDHARACAAGRFVAGAGDRVAWGEHARRERPRIGYLSGDLREHPVGRLLAGVLAARDPAGCEVLVYSHGPDDGHATRRRIRAACDRFVEISGLSDAEAARRIAADGVGILVDLQGFTRQTRPGILALRPAPVQVNWLGYPGTLGHPRLADYLIGDPVVTPLAHAGHFSETLALMPRCCLPGDGLRSPPVAPARGDVGLPEQGVVFCSFNTSHKFNAESFTIWCRLLREVPGSVLWLRDAHPRAVANLRREAGQRGIDPQRLRFAARAPTIEAHLDRLAVADLALDTFPYNSHVTGCDALWSGVPLLSRIGETFASRVGASLLMAVGLPELIVDNWEDYFALALALARDPDRLGEARARLVAAPLFDTPGFARDLERLYARMWCDHLAGRREPILLPKWEEGAG